MCHDISLLNSALLPNLCLNGCGLDRLNTYVRRGFLGAASEVALELGHVLSFQLLVLEISEKITQFFQFTGLFTVQETLLQAVEPLSHHLRFIVVAFYKLVDLFLCIHGRIFDYLGFEERVIWQTELGSRVFNSRLVN